jgi:hypothetical protein
MILTTLVIAVGVTALASVESATAQTAYEWSPQNTRTRLTGTLGFVPNGGFGATIYCKVALDFETGNAKRGDDKLAIIRTAKVNGKGCENVQFIDLPWYVGTENLSYGSLSRFGWISNNEACENDLGDEFFLPGGGQWDFFDTCLSGFLTASPPVSIILKP